MLFPFSFWKPSGPPPSPPSALTSSLTAIITATLNWTDNSSNETSFRIERDIGSGFTEIGSVGAGITTYTDASTPWNVNCSYRVRARNAGGSSAYSNTSTILTSGFDGALSLDAEELHLTCGEIKDYSSVSIINGSTLIYDSTEQMIWSILLCAGNFTQDNAASDSSIRVDGYQGSATDSTVATIAPDGMVLSYLQNQSYGGDAYSGSGGFGNGGGGGASGFGGNGAELSGGAGGAGLNAAAGGNGGTNSSQNGTDGDFDDETGMASEAWGGGGGGGFRGLNGNCLYIKVAGTMDATWGGGPPPISAIGTDGTHGGNGGGSISDQAGSAAGGNGGGGGGGGSGGKIVFRWKGVGSDPTLLLSVALGNGGNPGSGGIATCPGTTHDGLDGFSGTNGESGVIDLTTY